MSLVVKLLITLAAAGVVGSLFRKMGVPGGMMLGGIVGVALLNVIAETAYTPYFIRFFAQSVAGGFLGASIDRDKLKQLPRLAVPLVIIIGFLVLTDVIMAWLFVHLSPLDILTSLCSGIAGGINDVPLIAADMGADAGKVAVLQFIRLIVGIAIIPMMIRVMDKEAGQKEERSGRGTKKKKAVPLVKTAIGLAAAMAGGYVGRIIGLPGGVLLFSMIAVAAVHLVSGYGEMHSDTKVVAQLCSGAYVGCLFHRQDILELRFVLVPALILAMMFILNCLVTGYVLRKTTSMTIKESMLACSPAGAGEIALLSSDLNITADYAADIMILHIFRVIFAVAVFPQMIPFIARLF